MESMFTHVSQKCLNQPLFQYNGKRSSGSRIIGYGAHVPPFSADVPLFRSLKSVLTLMVESAENASAVVQGYLHNHWEFIAQI